MSAPDGSAASRALVWLHGPRPELRACAECGKPERRWRRMMWYPFSGTPGGAFICSDKCWDTFDAR